MVDIRLRLAAGGGGANVTVTVPSDESTIKDILEEVTKLFVAEVKDLVIVSCGKKLESTLKVKDSVFKDNVCDAVLVYLNHGHALRRRDAGECKGPDGGEVKEGDAGLPAALPAMPPGPPAMTVTVFVHDLQGKSSVLTADKNETFKEIKARYSVEWGIPVPSIRLIHGGSEIKDDDTIESRRIAGDTTIHLVKKNIILKDFYDKANLRGNCRICHTNTDFEPRALCSNPRCPCPENILITDGEVDRPPRGTRTWESLLEVRVSCLACKHEGPAHIGFLCMAKFPGAAESKRCPSADIGNRNLQCTYKGTGKEELREKLNILFGYAFAAGYEMRMGR